MWLARQRRQLHQACTHHPSPSFGRLVLASVRLFSTSARCRGAPAPPPAEPTHLVVDYLASSCGLSGAEALRASKPLAHLRSLDKPDAVLRFLRQEGLRDTHIKRVVLGFPMVLLSDVKKTLEPKIRALQGAGFSGPEIAQLMSLSPNAIYLRGVLHRVQFWRELVGSNRNLLKTLQRDTRLLSHDLDNKVLPGLSLLRSFGVPDNKMGVLILRRPRLVSAKPDRVRTVVEQVKSLGFSPGSLMFVQAILSISNLSRSTFDAKSKLLRSFGWTQAELVCAIQRFPIILSCSEKKIHTAMGFLLKEAGCDPSYIARHPNLVGYSVEKRLVPRYYVLRSLKMKGLVPKGKDLLAAMHVTEDNFVQKYIVPYKDKLPELLGAYSSVLTKKAEAGCGSL